MQNVKIVLIEFSVVSDFVSTKSPV